MCSSKSLLRIGKADTSVDVAAFDYGLVQNGSHIFQAYESTSSSFNQPTTDNLTIDNLLPQTTPYIHCAHAVAMGILFSFYSTKSMSMKHETIWTDV
ncbi:hypothetical protein BLOT_004343 [Blomia tropicalis]|nr:hypothetical protein BLOT_004343 [Blomia tropicalis]